MTNQQGAPEALRTITRYEVVDCIDSKHVPAVIPNKDGPWVLYEDHLAALVEAQQPAPSAAAVVNPDPHAELRKTWQPGQRWQARSFRNGQWGPWTDAVASEPFWFPHQDYRRHPDDLAPQPAPTPQADPLQPMVALQEEAGMYADDFAPQADSQPAPVRDYPPLPQGWPARFRCDSCDGNGEVGEPMYMGHFQPPERARCPDCDGRGWCSEEDAFSADHMRAYVDADRAMRAQADSVQDLQPVHDAVTIDLLNERVAYLERKLKEADSVTAPAGPGWQLVPTDPTNEMLDAARRACEGRMYPQDMRHGPRAMMADRYNAMLAAAPTQTVQVADSVLEDAARLEALHAAVTAIYLDDSSDFKSALGAVVRHLEPKLAGDLLAWPKRAFDISQARLDAARKQGANHE